MKRTKIKVIALASFVILCALVLASCGQMDSGVGDDTRAVETRQIEVYVPEDDVTIDPIKNGDVSPDEIPQDTDVFVIGHSVSEIENEEEIEEPIPDDYVIVGEREDDSFAADVIGGGGYNDDAVIAERIDQIREVRDGVFQNPTVETEVGSDVSGAEYLPSSLTESDDVPSDAPAFVDPAGGGTNPFAGGSSDIDDHNADEFVGEGDRPGEGIHF